MNHHVFTFSDCPRDVLNRLNLFGTRDITVKNTVNEKKWQDHDVWQCWVLTLNLEVIFKGQQWGLGSGFKYAEFFSVLGTAKQSLNQGPLKFEQPLKVNY